MSPMNRIRKDCDDLQQKMLAERRNYFQRVNLRAPMRRKCQARATERALDWEVRDTKPRRSKHDIGRTFDIIGTQPYSNAVVYKPL